MQYKYILLFVIVIIIILYNISTLYPPIKVIYFAHLNPDRWKFIITGQMKDLQSSGLITHVEKMYIVLTGDDQQIKDAKVLITNILSIEPHFITSNENHHEYLGIKTLYEIAKESKPDTLLLYFHSKGMVFHQHLPFTERLFEERVLTKHIIKRWKYSLSIFKNQPHIQKVCYATSEDGRCWYNFFWVRSQFIIHKCKPPVLSSDRYDYELYIGGSCDTTYKDCFNLVNHDKDFFSSYNISSLIRNDTP